MTIDDESSIYVGGIPYDSTEDTLRRIFDIYGSVVAVKIINDRSVGGKCYAFVTFTNPRSAMHAINEMDGQTVDGRVVRVNEVRTRGGRSSFGRDNFRRNSDRGIDHDRGSSREKDYDHGRDRYLDDFREHSREHEQGHHNMRDHDQMRDQLHDRERFRGHDHDLDDYPRERERMRDYNLERVRDTSKDIQRTANHHKASEHDKDEMPKSLERSYSNERGKRDRSLESSDDDHAEVTKKLEISNHKFQDLQKEITEMEELAEEKKLFILKLQEKSKKLEDSLTAAKRDKSYREMQLAKLTKCYLQVRDCSERLKHSEQELQSLVNSTISELEHGTAMGARDGIMANGSV